VIFGYGLFNKLLVYNTTTLLYIYNTIMLYFLQNITIHISHSDPKTNIYDTSAQVWICLI